MGMKILTGYEYCVDVVTDLMSRMNSGLQAQESGLPVVYTFLFLNFLLQTRSYWQLLSLFREMAS